MEHDDKTMALAKHLKVDPALITNEYGDYFNINQRTVKQGMTPEEYKKLAEDFRAVLDDECIELVTNAMLNPLKEIRWKKPFEKKGKIEKQDVVDSLQDFTYEFVSMFLDGMSEPAEKRVKQLKRLNAGEWKPPVKETPLDIYTRLKKEHLYVSNVLYHLVKDSVSHYSNTNYSESLRRAWLGQPVSDTRKDVTVDDGEYRVLLDDEADEAVEEYLDDMFEQIVDVPSHLTKYVDKQKWIDDQSGYRGESLNGYDGTEAEEEFEGTTYYIYRNN